jgi:hypothetical protein
MEGAMRRWLAILIAGVACCSTGSAAGQVPPGDSVTGSGTFTDGLPFSFDVHSGPSGENPTGTAVYGFFAPGTVTCLHVEGNIAIMQVNISTFSFPITIKVTDNAPDRVEVAPAAGSPCGASVGIITGIVGTGDIVVHDGPPLPTSTDQCKSGGWKIYGVFKNQGDCVSFVATKGKNGPVRR